VSDGAELSNTIARIQRDAIRYAEFEADFQCSDPTGGPEAALKQLVDAGARVCFYLKDRERTLETAMDKVMLSLTNFAAEMEREKARQRTHNTLRRKAEAGHVAGGVVYGYRNVEVLAPGPEGRDRRAHVVRDVDPEQAAVVRRLFQLCAAGKGLVRIAKALNAEGLPARAAGRGRRRPSGEILHRELYRGVIVWNKTRWVDRGGTKVKVDRPETEWLRVEAPTLRIVDQDLWQAVRGRLARTRTAYLRVARGRLWGHPEAGLESRYLLTGFIVCAACGSSFLVRNRTSRGHLLHSYYACTYHRLRGRAACANGLTMPMADTNAAVVETIRRKVLSSEVVTVSIEKALAGYHVASTHAGIERATLERTLRRLDAECRRLADAIASGAALGSVVAALRAREAERTTVQVKLERLDGLSRAARAWDREDIVRAVRDRLSDWHGLLESEPVQAWQFLRNVLAGRIVFTAYSEAPQPY
jgi:hypothetical protein